MGNLVTKGKAIVGALFVKTGTIDTSAGQPIKLNSRNFVLTSGDLIAVQVKPNASVTGTATLYGAQFSPRFADAIGGNSLIGVQSDCILKGTTGTLSGDIRAYDAALTDENLAGRTVSGIACMLQMRHQLRATVTGGVYGVRALVHGGVRQWSGLVFADVATNLAAKHTNAGVALTADTGWIRVRVGDTHYKIALYND